MQQNNNISGLFLTRLGFVLATFFIFVFTKKQLLAYQQLYQQYAAMIGQISQAAIGNTANIAQLSTVISTFGAVTQHYLLLIFVGTPLFLFLAYLIFEGTYWKLFLHWKTWKTFYLRFTITSFIGSALIITMLSFLWNSITLEDYTFSPQLLLFPLLLFIVLGYLTLIYVHLTTGLWQSIRQAWKTIINRPLFVLLFSLGNFFIFFVGMLSFFYTFTHYEQNITTLGTYTSSIFLIISILGSVYYQNYFLPYLSIKK